MHRLFALFAVALVLAAMATGCDKASPGAHKAIVARPASIVRHGTVLFERGVGPGRPSVTQIEAIDDTGAYWSFERRRPVDPRASGRRVTLVGHYEQGQLGPRIVPDRFAFVPGRAKTARIRRAAVVDFASRAARDEVELGLDPFPSGGTGEFCFVHFGRRLSAAVRRLAQPRRIAFTFRDWVVRFRSGGGLELIRLLPATPLPQYVAAFSGIAATTNPAMVARWTDFHLPSGDIGCTALGGQIRCDIGGGPRPTPREYCELDWTGVELRPQGSATPVCAGDTAIGTHLLRFGATWRKKPFTCWSRKVGLICISDRGHGFFLSRKDWRVW